MSSEPNGNTNIILKFITDIIEKNNINVQIINLSELELKPCSACFACRGKKQCINIHDDFNAVFNLMKDADAIILGSPVYSADVSSRMKTLLDRAAVVVATNSGLFKHKIGVSIAAVRRAGGITAIDT